MPGLRFLPPVVVVALAGLVLLGCRAQPGSWVEAHNQTTVPIVLVEEYDHSEWLVEACSAREFNLTGADIPTKPGQIPVGALRFPISLVGPADAAWHSSVVVSTDGVHQYRDDKPPSQLAPCRGVPPTPMPSPDAP